MSFIEFKNEVIRDLRNDAGMTNREIFKAFKAYGKIRQDYEHEASPSYTAVRVMKMFYGLS